MGRCSVVDWKGGHRGVRARCAHRPRATRKRREFAAGSKIAKLGVENREVDASSGKPGHICCREEPETGVLASTARARRSHSLLLKRLCISGHGTCRCKGRAQRLLIRTGRRNDE